MSEDVYEQLIKWLVTTFRALPEIDSPEFREVVHLMYTPEEASLALEIGPKGGKLNELAAKTKRNGEELEAILEAMGEKGTMYIQPGSEDPIYRPLGVEAPGIFETVGWLRPNAPLKNELIDRLTKFRTIYVDEGISRLGSHCSAWCAVSALPPDALPQENLFEFLKRIDYIAVSDCTCRQMERHATRGKACGCIVECCMSLGEMARWAVEQGMARQITYEEALEILKGCEKNGQIHMGPPGPSLCNCCKHGCINLSAMERGLHHAFQRNHFYSVTDHKNCKTCGMCVQYCPVKARKIEEDKVTINRDDCIGCGACVMKCKNKAASMVYRSQEEIASIDLENYANAKRVGSMSTIDPLVLETIIKNTKAR